ncbi:PKD domain-containing protein [Haloarcula sp. S1CR25-12]|uniref:PKD domain-containing protein n=1 Tax=Haloarcula saliterrae TaxID=2950534 RepID=A0ABU2FB76_9EURY|nr:PKD domain-containing protein [Haloarcula sp. S1CR25-12]MDS0259494.1 PKD domain-containing protein [Haloarcula sp. S1CR25-12]
MDLVGDRRGQSIQIGAILLFAVLVIAFASYQAFVVPSQNSEVEFNHNQQVQSELQDLRNAIVSVGGVDRSRSVSVRLGTRYPSRLAARNPSPPSGSLRTVGTTDERVDLTIANAQASGEAGDFWNESQRYNTGAITYRPSYNVYTNGPTTTYEQTVLYNRFRTGNTTVANQSFIDGTDISLVALNGTLSRSSTGTTSVDVRSVSSSTERIRLTDDGTPINITFTSTRPATYWDFLENTQPNVTDVRLASSGNGFYNVTVELQPDQSYMLQLTKVGVGTGVIDEPAAYLTDVEWDGDSVPQGGTKELTLEVRDRFNNPPGDAGELTVNASVADDGSFQSSGAGDATKTPDEDGKVTFVYEATGSAGRQEIRFSYTTINGSFEASTPEDVSVNVTVQPSSSGGGGRLVSLNNGQAFDGNGNGVAGAFSVTVENRVGRPVELTDVAVVPENSDINGLSDESDGTAPGESELAVENLATGETRVVELGLFTGAQYGFVSGRGTVLSLESPTDEETYSVSSGSFGTVETDLTGSAIELGSGESADVTFAEFWTVGGSTAVPANVSGETFRLAVTYAAGGSRVADEFVVNVAPPSASPGNSPPMADIAGPSSASVGDPLTFDAGGSSDPDGDTLSYEWDLDDDGAYDDDTGETASTSFGSSGDQTVSVRVSDGNGGSDTASQTVTVSGDSGATTVYPTAFNDRDNDNTESGEDESLPPAPAESGNLASFSNMQAADGSLTPVQDGGQTTNVGIELDGITTSADDYRIETRYESREYGGVGTLDLVVVDSDGNELQRKPLRNTGETDTLSFTVNDAAEQAISNSGAVYLVVEKTGGNYARVDFDYIRATALTDGDARAGGPPSASVTVTTGNCNNGNGAGYCAAWSASDTDGDLTNVTTVIEDSDGNALSTVSNTFGQTNSRNGEDRHEGISGTAAKVRVIATDANGNEVTFTRPAP